MPPVVDVEALRSAARSALDAAWRPPGFAVPNPETYPHQWLWDSCFHSLVWLELDRADRAVAELASALGAQDPETGFVPHMTYWSNPDASEGFWGRRGRSCLTQPPIHGHAAATLTEAGLDLPGELLDRIAAGFAHLTNDRERTPAGLVPVHHPWETGCDDSPRWDAFRRTDRTWRRVKADLVADLAVGDIERGRPGPVAERRLPAFTVGSVGFNALLVWSGRRFLTVRPDPDLADALDRLAEAVGARWEPDRRTWIDDGPPSGRARTLDGLLPLLIDPRPEAWAELIDPAAFGARYGPCGVHRGESTFRPDRYWRGSAWPQLTYLFALAARAHGADDLAASLATSLVEGAAASSLAEYWHPDTGRGLGARPQSWTGLALIADRWRTST